MAIQIDPREVLEHLEYLGYTSITKEQLKEFIRDLKKLIKYEQNKERKSPESGQNPIEKVSVACETSLPFVSLSSYSKDKPSSAHEEIIGLNIPTRDQETLNKQPCLQKSYHAHDYEEQCCCCVPNDKHSEEKCRSKVCFKKDIHETEKHPLPSYIRTSCARPARHDPVSLYHYYQNEWAKRTLPGEDPRNELRWAVRNKLAAQQRAAANQQALFRKTTSIDGIHRKKFQL